MAERVQLRRAKGWRKPIGTVVVSRPSRWGNPFVVGEPHPTAGRPIADRTEAVALHESLTRAMWEHYLPEFKDELRGHNLACWCPLDQPCHADVLLELANAADIDGSDEVEG